MELLCEAKTSTQIAYDINVLERIVRANIIRMWHIGQVIPIAIETWDHDGGASAMVWDLTKHTREHKDLQPRCYGCRLRERYLATDEALIE